MSLESLIEENIKATRELTAALSALAGAQAAIGTAKATSGNSKPAATATAATPSTVAAPAAPEQKAENSAAPVDYDAVKTPFLALWKKDSAKANAVLAEYGVNNLKLVPAEKFAEVKVKVEAALA